jgi:hypothetical protein
VVLEPVGADVEDCTQDEGSHDVDCRAGCGSCDCGSGGCGSEAATRDSARSHSVSGSHGDSTAAHAGCASCGISQLLAARRRGRG